MNSVNHTFPRLDLILGPLLPRLQSLLRDEEPWIVGGFLRDALLGRPSHDLDLALPRGSISAARKLATALQGTLVILDEGRGCARVVFPWEGERWEIDLTDFRAPTLDDDLRDRDFTLNAMAASLHRLDRWVDPTQGRKDLERRIIRLTSSRALEEDPLRVLRAVRLAAELEFSLAEESRSALKEASARLPDSAPERSAAELLRAFDSSRPDVAARELAALGVRPILFPEAAEDGIVALQSLQAIENSLTNEVAPNQGFSEAARLYAFELEDYLNTFVEGDRSRRSWIRWATYLLGNSRLENFSGLELRLKSLRFSRDLVRMISLMDRGRQLIKQWILEEGTHAPSTAQWRIRAYRFHREVGEAYLAVLLFTQSAYPSEPESTLLAELLVLPFEEPEVINPPVLVGGRDLLESLGREAGPWVGHALEAIREAQVGGEIHDRTSALRFANELSLQKLVE